MEIKFSVIGRQLFLNFPSKLPLCYWYKLLFVWLLFIRNAIVDDDCKEDLSGKIYLFP